MKFNTFLCGCLTTLAAIIAIALVLHQNRKRLDDTSPQTVEVVTDTVPVFIDTPIPVDSTVIRYVSIRTILKDTIHTNDTIKEKADTVFVELPITQKIYEDTLYTAWVSGYEPSLDSIQIFQPVTTITVSETKFKAKKWGIGLQVGVGVTPNKIEPYIGVGVTYNFFSW